MSILEIGCCGAYCKPCIQHQQEKYPDEKSCKGCKFGYETENGVSIEQSVKLKSAVSKKNNYKPALNVQSIHATFWKLFLVKDVRNTENN